MTHLSRAGNTALQIEQLRTKLLDLRGNNPFISFKHSERSQTQVRVVNAVPDIFFNHLADGRTLTFVPLPKPEGEPADERAEGFQTAVREAKLTDETYLSQLASLAEEDSEEKLARIERELKDRIRDKRRMPARRGGDRPELCEWARQHSVDADYDLAATNGAAIVPLDVAGTNIQTLLFPEALERELGGLLSHAHTSIQETVVNTLYCVFGFLEWYESDASDRPIFSPLLLHSVELQRKLQSSTYRFSISSMGEETEANITMNERFMRDFNLRLPPLEEGEGPEAYFAKVSEVIKERPRWGTRRFLTIGCFSFARLVMYRDLDAARWLTSRPLILHTAVRELLSGSNRDAAFFSEVHDADAPEVAKAVPLLITDADSSQFSAVVDVMRGGNLAIEAPPGTGKSQTITNIIAAALTKGQRVLFIAEKIAALEIVKKRLDDAGLGEFCLELHSTKAKKDEVLASLGTRLEMQGRVPSPAELSEALT